MREFDFLIIGSGVAGLSYALQVANQLPEARIAIVTKADENESNTKYAQGGIAVVIDEIADSFEQHIADTLKAGDGLCDRAVVEKVITQGPNRLRELIEWGAAFDKKTNGQYDLGLEGGHSKNRILHRQDATGLEVEQVLLKQIHAAANISVWPQHLAIDLITEHQLAERADSESSQPQCYGAYVLNIASRSIETFSATVTLLAAGGIGQVYQNTTNPTIATGDGIAMAYRANALIENMAFVQFHPTALHDPTSNPSFLISEAVRGFGAILRNKAGDAFMHRYDPRKELASRDVVCRAIESELQKSGEECVYLDCRHLDLAKFKAHFPHIYNKLSMIGIDPHTDMIPVIPAAHYLCGGISVNEFGQTTIGNLFACGECAHTGLHGANRLASNSLLEALVYAHNCCQKSIELFGKTTARRSIPEWDDSGTTQPKELILITHNMRELKAMMSNYMGVVRSDERLARAAARLEVLYEETEQLYKKTKISAPLIELRNMISVAHLIVEQSAARTENRGGFYNVDLVREERVEQLN